MDQSVDRRQVLKVGAGVVVAAAAVSVLPAHADAVVKKPVGSAGIERLWGFSNKKKKILKTKAVWIGTDKATLNKGGLCHWIGTPKPLAKGNCVLFGHRTTAGGLLRLSHKIKVGDKIVLTITGQGTKTYVVVRDTTNATSTAASPTAVIGSRDFAQAINWGDKTKANLTLVGCTKTNKLPTSTKFRLLIRATEI